MVIIGAGPGGMGPLITAARKGKLRELLQKGVLWIDARPPELFGSGQLGNMDPERMLCCTRPVICNFVNMSGNYVINSNTSASIFSKAQPQPQTPTLTLIPALCS